MGNSQAPMRFFKKICKFSRFHIYLFNLNRHVIYWTRSDLSFPVHVIPALQKMWSPLFATALISQDRKCGKSCEIIFWCLITDAWIPLGLTCQEMPWITVCSYSYSQQVNNVGVTLITPINRSALNRLSLQHNKAPPPPPPPIYNCDLETHSA